jgi:hypothetical protein
MMFPMKKHVRAWRREEGFMYWKERKVIMDEGEEGNAGEEEVNWEMERRKRKSVIGPQIRGTTNHLVRVRICVRALLVDAV